MQKDVRTNFEEKVSYIAHTLPGMTVTEHSDFLAVDCGLPSDTFNVLVVREMSTQAEMLAMVDRFNAKRFPLAVWYWGGHLADPDQALFLQHGLWPAETHVAMAANLSEVKAGALPPPDLELKRVTTASELLQFGEVTAALFGASDEGRHVFAYFERLAQHPPSRFPAMRHYLGTLDGTVVAIGTLIVGSQTTGV
jgi:hypothetical protein